MRVAVLSPEGKPLMPTKPSRARKWLKIEKAKVVYNDLGIFTVELVKEPSGTQTQLISVGVDPGKLYTGIGVQSAKATLQFTAKKVQLLQRSTGLIVVPSTGLSNLPLLKGSI